MKQTKFPNLSELALAIAIVVSLVLLLNPFNFIMTSAVTLTIIMILAVCLLAFGVFVWREQPRDEREALHGLQASRLSYFLGATVLITAIIVQAIGHKLDVWLALTLGVMVLSKLAVSIWSRRR